MHFAYVFCIAFVAFQISDAKVLQQVPDVTRQIHGSYGDFRDFTREGMNFIDFFVQIIEKHFIYFMIGRLNNSLAVLFLNILLSYFSWSLIMSSFRSFAYTLREGFLP